MCRGQVAADGQPDEEQRGERGRTASMKTTTIWYSMASSGDAPGGSVRHHPRELHQPTVIMPLTVGIIAARTRSAPSAAPRRGRRSRGRATPPPRPSGTEIGLETVARQRRARHGVAEDHAGDRDRVLGSYQGRTRTTTPITHASVIAVDTVIAVAAIS